MTCTLSCVLGICIGLHVCCAPEPHKAGRSAPPCNLMSIYYGEERRKRLDICICLQFPNGTWQRSLAMG